MESVDGVPWRTFDYNYSGFPTWDSTGIELHKRKYEIEDAAKEAEAKSRVKQVDWGITLQKMEILRKLQGEDYVDLGLRNTRIGDVDRNRYIEHLGNMFAEGYLTDEEFEQRSDRAAKARYYSDLTDLITDLPPIPGPVAKTVPTPLSERSVSWVGVACAGLLVVVILLMLVIML